MKVQYVTPFIAASIKVFETLVGISPSRGDLSVRPQLFTSKQINILCGLTGEIQGQVIYGMSQPTALNIAGKMAGMEIQAFDDLAASAIAELGNMVSGNSVTLLAEQGFVSDITPPTIIKGTNICVSSLDIPALVIPLTLGEIGQIDVNVALRERPATIAA